MDDSVTRAHVVTTRAFTSYPASPMPDPFPVSSRVWSSTTRLSRENTECPSQPRLPQRASRPLSLTRLSRGPPTSLPRAHPQPAALKIRPR